MTAHDVSSHAVVDLAREREADCAMEFARICLFRRLFRAPRNSPLPLPGANWPYVKVVMVLRAAANRYRPRCRPKPVRTAARHDNVRSNRLTALTVSGDAGRRTLPSRHAQRMWRIFTAHVISSL